VRRNGRCPQYQSWAHKNTSFEFLHALFKIFSLLNFLFGQAKFCWYFKVEMRIRKTILALVCQVFSISFGLAQTTSYNFHRLTTAEGLSDGTIRGIAQDKYGYIWIATVTSLNRYDGYSVKTFNYSEKDSSFFPYGFLRCLYSDKNGNLWMGMNTGLYKFNFKDNHFELQAGSKNIAIIDFAELNKDTLFIATNNGLAIYLQKHGEFKMYASNVNNQSSSLLKKGVHDLYIYRNSKLFLATDTGLVVIDIKENITTRIALDPIGNGSTHRITADKFGNVWVTFGFNNAWLLRTDFSFSKFKVYDKFSYSPKGINDNTIPDLLTDNKGRLWLSTASNGIVLYDAEKDVFQLFSYDPQQPMSIAANALSVLYQDRNGFIWVGSEGYGVSYFHPDNNLFHCILPSVNSIQALPGKWCRAFAEDEKNNLWMGVGGGLVYYNIKTKQVKLWQNSKDHSDELHNNSIRSVLCDNDHHVWIGTANGVDCFNTQTLEKENIKDADTLPLSFYWAMLQDHNKTIWFGSRDGLYFYNPVNKEIHSIGIYPVLSKYNGWGVKSLFEDSKNRLWIGLNGYGLLMYDASLQQCRYWKRTDSSKTAIPNNHITSFAEDKKGIIWVGTLDGLTAYDPAKDSFTHYTTENGFISTKAACLMADKKDRLWIGTSKGLVVLDSARKSFRYFDKEDGLPINEFNEQCAYKMRDGRFVFPSMNGFVLFDPLQYSETSTAVNVYVSSFKVSGKEYKTSVNPEELTAINLKPYQNFFSLELSAPNYANPRQTWYAYKLSPLNKDWIYTQDRNINYTNVPGSDYTFQFKATTDPNNWNVPAKTITIHVGIVFYKTAWFLLLVLLFITGLIYSIYRYRLLQQNKIYVLQTKAQELEKEKALAMYENLKQHLNPHFLFNSLTSLSSLIRFDQKLAGEFLDSLSKIYRYILKSRDNETVSLGEEIKFVQTFIRLQQTRFTKGLQVNIDVDETYNQSKIAPVTLQNLIENAIKHNIIDDESPLMIDIFTEDNYLIVKNNLQKKNFVETSNQQGLSNLQSLYRYLSSKPVIIIENEQCFFVKIPLIEDLHHPKITIYEGADNRR
jgi:ligand-binding sensor domain-containing protein